MNSVDLGVKLCASRWINLIFKVDCMSFENIKGLSAAKFC